MAITYTEVLTEPLGTSTVNIGYLTFDGTATTVNLPCGTIDGAFLMYGHGTGNAGTTVSWSTNTLTVSAADTSGRTHYLIWFGSA